MTNTTFNNNYCYSFGLSPDLNWLSADNIKDVIADAFDHTQGAASPDLACIIDILDQVSKAWADPSYHLRRQALKKLPQLLNFSQEMIEEGLNAVSHICSRKSITQRLEGEFGSYACLDRFCKKPELASEIAARPRGVLLHLTSGNVFVGAVDSLVSGIITKNVNILKMSRIDPLFPVLFLESIREHDPQELIWKHQAILHWKGGDTTIENPLLEAPLTVVFWGGFEALESIKARIGANTTLIANGPRYSFAVLDANSIQNCLDDNSISALALDLSRWDQQACSSPHVVYVIDTSEDSLHALMESLYDEMMLLKDELPLGNLTFDEKVEIRKVRELTRMLSAKGQGRLLCPEDFSFTLVYEANTMFKVSCLNRTLFFKLVKNIDELIDQIAPISAYLQTVGITCSNDIYDQLVSELISVGAKRITDIGGMSEGHDGTPHEGNYLLRNLVTWVTKEYRTCHQGRIENLMRNISSSEYYAKQLHKVGGVAFANFIKLPLLDRETWYDNSPPKSNAILTAPLTDAYVYASGGTTGEPKFTFYSNSEYRYSTQVLTSIYKNAGIQKSDRVANLFIAGNLWTSFNVAGRALENIGCLHLPIGGSSNIDNIFKYLSTFDVNAIVGLPSIIINLAQEAEKRNIDIRIDKILYGGEHLRPQTCEYLKKIFKTSSIKSAGYACVDTGPVGWQCQYLTGSVHHILQDYSYVEIVDTTTSELIADDSTGELVVTNLNRTLMPVLRYRTGDSGRWVFSESCKCGYKGPSFELLGRCDDLLVIGGINLFPADIAAGLAHLPVSHSFQVVASLVDGREHLCLRLEADNKLDDELVIKELCKASYKLSEAVSKHWLNISIEWFQINKIERNKRTGKLKTVLDQR